MNVKPLDMRNIEACIFDFDGTLYLSSSGIEGQIKSRFRDCAMRYLGLGEIEVKELLERYRRKYRSSVLGLKRHHGIDPFEFYEELYGGIDISAIIPKPNLGVVLPELARIVPLFVLSNSNRSFVKRGLAKLGLQDCITEIFTVENHNFIRKPYREVYVSTVSRVGQAPSSILMFDDIPSSLKTAKDVGIVTVLVGNGLREAGFVDLHTGEEYQTAPGWCDYSAQDITIFIRSMLDSQKS